MCAHMPFNIHIKLFLSVTISATVVTSLHRVVWIKKANLVLGKTATLYDASCHNKTVVCELRLPEHQRKKPDFKISDVDPFLCTHILYRQAELDATTLTINDKPKGYRENMYKEVSQLRKRNPNLKLIFSVGESGPKSTSAVAYGIVAGDWEKRKEFTKSVLHLLGKYNFQGVDVAWINAGIKEGGGSAGDFHNLLILMKELRTVLQDNYMLTLTLVGVHGEVFEFNHWDTLTDLVDHIHVQTFDIVQITSGFAYHHACIHENIDGFTSLEHMLLLYTKKIAPGKLVPVLPSHGQGYLLTTEVTASAGVTQKSKGSYTVDRPSYGEICRNLTKQPGWTTYIDETCQVPFATRGRWWLSFDDLNSIKLKIDFVMKMGLKGVGLSSICNDDFTGMAGGPSPKYPLLTTIHQEIAHNLGSTCPIKQEKGTESSSKYLFILAGMGVALFICFVVVMVIIFVKKGSARRVSMVETKT